MKTPKCNPHKDAPHGFDRNESHSQDRYVCTCEKWIAPWPAEVPSAAMTYERRLHALTSLPYDERCAKLHAENEELSRCLELQGKVMRQLVEALGSCSGWVEAYGERETKVVVRAALAAAKEKA